MKAIIIAAGMGSRLQPLTQDVPKCLAVAAGNKTLFDMQVETLRQAGIRDIVVVRGYQGEKFTRTDVRYVWNREFARNGILGSLMKAETEFDDDLIISYSDIWFESGIPSALVKTPGDMVIVVDRQWQQTYEGRSEHPLSEAEAVEMDGQNRLRRIGKIAHEGGPIHAEFIGMMKLSRQGAAQFKAHYDEVRRVYSGKAFQRAASFEKAYVTDMLQDLTDGHVSVTCLETSGAWREIDTVQDFEKLVSLWKQRNLI